MLERLHEIRRVADVTLEAIEAFILHEDKQLPIVFKGN
jgi:hypothetical protein